MILVTLWILAFFLMAAWITLSLGAAMQARKFARRYAWAERQTFLNHRPRTAVIVPFKGVEPGLQAHLDRLCAQDYDDYTLVFVVESEDDPAYALLEEQRRRHPGKVTLIVAGHAPPTRGQKVHNQLAAIEHLEQAGGGETAWAFADSDAAPDRDWLARLVGPLCHEQTGATTGYRWLVPEPGQRATLWTHAASVINSSVMMFAGTGLFRYAWGGSMAVRTETARRGRLAEDYWDGALSDDYQLSAMCHDLGLNVVFVHQCVVASPVHFTLGGLLGFARRQYLITRTHRPGVYAAGLATLGVWCLAMLSTWAVLVLGLVFEPHRPGWMIAAGTMAVVFALHQARASYRRRAMRGALGDEAPRRYAATLQVDRWLTGGWMLLHALMMAGALAGRTIRWRGRRYRIDRPTQVRQLNA